MHTLLALLLGALSVPAPPQSVAETAAMREARSIVESQRAAPAVLLTTAETSGFEETGTYAEAIRLYRALAQASPYAQLKPAGTTAEGRTMYLFVVSKDRAFSAATARRTGKPVVLLQNGIHPGENGGKDAAIMLLRDVLVTRRLSRWLDKVILLSIPVFNVDGHEHTSPYNRINENGPRTMGFRVTAQRLNLNRDYVKADTPEMRAWLRLYTAWLPDFLIDNHVTDGSDHPYDVTLATHTEQDVTPPVGAWVKNTFIARLLPAMEGDGHAVGWYGGDFPTGDRFPVLTSAPRFSDGYAAAQNRAALLVETHSLKTFRTRVWSHYDIMRHAIDIIAGDATGLRKATREADQAMRGLRRGDKVFLEGRPGNETEPYTVRRLETERYNGEAAGGPVTRYTPKPLDRPVQLVRSLAPKLEVEAPLGYIVPRPWTEVIDRLRAHGIELEVIPKELRGEFESVRFSSVRFATAPFEGRFQVTAASRTVREMRVIPAGSVYVPIAQRAARLVMHILEPGAPDSAVRWGFFQPVFEQKEYFAEYVFEPIAAQLLRENVSLRNEFEAKLRTDAAFAGNPRGRLRWLYERSPYFEQDKDAYPVVRVIEKIW